MTIFSPSASASPNRRPIAAALCSSAEVDLTGVSRSVNQPHSACTLSPIHWNTGLSGSNAALMGPAAALNPSTTPPRNAVMGCQYFQTTSATPASAVTTRPIGLSRAPNRPDMAYRATRSIASGPDASTRSTVPAAASPPRSTARGFINITATARKPDNPDRKSATGAPATVFRTFPVSDAVRRKDDNGAVSKPAALPDEAMVSRAATVPPIYRIEAPTQIIIQTQPGQSAQDIAREVARQLDERERRLKAKARSNYSDQGGYDA